MWGDIAIAFVLAFIIAFVVTPYTIRIAKKVGAIDYPKDERRVNTKPMPRLRWTSGNCRLYSFCCLFVNSNEYRRYHRFIWTRNLLAKTTWIYNRNNYNRYCLLYRWFKRWGTSTYKINCTNNCSYCNGNLRSKDRWTSNSVY